MGSVLTDWKTLSLSEFGEKVIVKDVRDGMLIVRINAFPRAVALSKLYASYKKRLAEEVSILEEDRRPVVCNCVCWTLYSFKLDSEDFPVVLYAICEKDGMYCTISANCPSFAAMEEFIGEFGSFSRSVEFKCYERGVLEDAGLKIEAIGISDVVLKAEQDNVLLFFGKNKYFFVSISSVSQLDIIRNADCTDSVRLLGAYAGEESVWLFDVLHDGRISGSIEVRTIPYAGKFVNVFGYWSGIRQTNISEHLIVRVEEEETSHAKELKV